MKAHPAEISQELKKFHFFRSFPDDLLLQISTLVSAVKFAKGEFIIQENHENHCLYFIRSGQAEVLLSEEVVALLQTPGEVIGEMSVVTEKPASTSIRAASDLECFKIDTKDFGYVPVKEKDHFLYLLYRIYSNVLVDRLTKTNEKARLFEIANRDLHQAQMGLEKTGDKKVLLVGTDKKQLVLAKMAMGSTNVHLDTASDMEAAKELLSQNVYDALIADETCLEILHYAEEKKATGRNVMMLTKDVRSNLTAIKDMLSVNHMMTRDPEDRNLTIRTILTTLTKVLSSDIFGLEKYLTWGVEVKSLPVKGSAERDQLKEDMCVSLKKRGLRNTIIDRVNTVAEELLMNAIYDAPTDSKGNPLFNHITRKTEIILESHLQSTLRYASDGVYLAVSVTDPFGGLTKSTILKYLQSCYEGAANLNEGQAKGGAGRGLHQIVENSDLTIFNVKKGKKTEVICLFLVEGQKRELQPSFHYFFN